jgi:uncharacterized protein (TIGR03437 family)
MGGCLFGLGLILECRLLCSGPSVTANGKPGKVLYSGIAPGLVQGANQVNFQLPEGVKSGKLSIALTVGSAESRPYTLVLP